MSKSEPDHAQATEPQASKLMKGSECAWLGLAIYLAVALAMAALWMLVLWVSFPQAASGIIKNPKPLFHLGRTLYVGLPFAAFFGACSGWWMHTRCQSKDWIIQVRGELQESGAGNRRLEFFDHALSFAPLLLLPLSLRWWGLILLISLMVHFRVNWRSFLQGFYPQLFMRGVLRMIIFIILYLLIAVGAAFLYFAANIQESTVPSGRDVAWPFGLMLFAALGMSDYVLVWWLCAWKRAGRLAEAPGRFQFSLSALLTVVLLVGAWVSGLFLYFRK